VKLKARACAPIGRRIVAEKTGTRREAEAFAEFIHIGNRQPWCRRQTISGIVGGLAAPTHGATDRGVRDHASKRLAEDVAARAPSAARSSGIGVASSFRADLGNVMRLAIRSCSAHRRPRAREMRRD
jgi:hypothetical protein